MSKKHKHYLVRYVYHKDTHYSYKMFDQLKNATDYYTELRVQGLKVSLFTAKEIDVEFKVEVKL